MYARGVIGLNEKSPVRGFVVWGWWWSIERVQLPEDQGEDGASDDCRAKDVQYGGAHGVLSVVVGWKGASFLGKSYENLRIGVY